MINMLNQNTQPGPWEGGCRVERDIFPRKSLVRNATKPYLLYKKLCTWLIKRMKQSLNFCAI